MEPDLMTTIVKNANVVSHRYKRRCWHASVEDLVQESVCAQLEAVKRGTFNPDLGRPLGAYLFYVAVFSARALLIKSGSPVSTCHRLDNLKHLTRAPVEELTLVTENPERAQSECQIHDRVVRCLGHEGAVFAYAMFVEGWKPAEVAAANGRPVRDVYQAVNDMRRALSGDALLVQMWKEIR